jgi:predicted alpha/beta superfamily hydrolase
VSGQASDAIWHSAVALLEELAHSNLESLEIAKRLMRAQEVADAESARANQAIDHAAEAVGHTEAVDAAVAAVQAAERASEAEQALTYSWAVHRCQVGRLTEAARVLTQRLPPADAPPAGREW